MLSGGDTAEEIQRVLEIDFELPSTYQDFLARWMVFNRSYNSLGLGSQRDREKVLEVGDKFLADRWSDFSELAAGLVSLECVGSEPVQDARLLGPNKWVKGATHYLRDQLGIPHGWDGWKCRLATCRTEKRLLCDSVSPEEWRRSKMAALLRLVYQVRCNLVHGDKSIVRQDVQTDRDRELIEMSIEIVDCALSHLLDGPMPDPHVSPGT